MRDRPAAPEIPFERRVILLKNLHGFMDLSQSVLADLAGQLQQEQFAAGSLVVAERQMGDRMFIIEDGVAEVSTMCPTGSVSLGEIAAGEMFGEIALLSKIRRRKATVSALTHLVTLSLSAEAFEKTMRAYPQVLANFMALAEALMNEKLLRISANK